MCTSVESQENLLLQRLHDNEKLKDYEYCQLVERELRRDAVLPAINAVIQSHLHSVVLDAQTYNSVFGKVQQHSLDVSFVAVLYRLYRLHLSPNPLMAKMMEALLGCQESYPLVKRDYEYLKLEVPKLAAKGRRLGQLRKLSEEDPKDKIHVDSIIVEPKTETSVDRPADYNDTRLTEELAKLLNPFANCDVKLYDVKMEFFSDDGIPTPNSEQNGMHNGMMYDSDSEEEVEEDDSDELTFNDMLANVKSLRIGRIEITHRKTD